LASLAYREWRSRFLILKQSRNLHSLAITFDSTHTLLTLLSVWRKRTRYNVLLAQLDDRGNRIYTKTLLHRSLSYWRSSHSDNVKLNQSWNVARAYHSSQTSKKCIQTWSVYVKRKLLNRALRANATEYYCRRVVGGMISIWRLKTLRETAKGELEGVADWYWEKRVYARVFQGWVECECFDGINL
jgi:hypothetical protein